MVIMKGAVRVDAARRVRRLVREFFQYIRTWIHYQTPYKNSYNRYEQKETLAALKNPVNLIFHLKSVQ